MADVAPIVPSVAGVPEANAPTGQPGAAVLPQEAPPQVPTGEAPPVQPGGEGTPEAQPTTPETPDVQAQLESERRIRQQIERERTEERLRRAQNIEDQQALQQSAAAYARQLMERHALTEDQAREISLREHQRVYQDYLRERSRQEQVEAATRIAAEHGIDRTLIANLPSAAAMQSVAEAYAGVASIRRERDTLRAENEQLKKRLAPAQQFNSGAASAPGMGVTRDNIDVLYSQDPVRYGPVYRKFLSTGRI